MKVSTFVYLDEGTTEEDIKEIDQNVRRVQDLAGLDADIFIAKDINPQVEGRTGYYPYFQNRKFHDGYCLQVCSNWKNCTIHYANRFAKDHPNIVDYCPFGLHVLATGIEINGRRKGIIASEAFLSDTPTPKQLLNHDAGLKKEIVPFLPHENLTKLKTFYDIVGSQLKSTLSITHLSEQLQQASDNHQIDTTNPRLGFNDLLRPTSFEQVLGVERPVQDELNLPYISEAIQKAVDYLQQNYRDKITLEDVAVSIHLNPQYLSRIFKKEIGQSFVDHLNKLRIKHACELLKQTNYPIYRIAIEVGFSDAPYFTRVFVKYMNMTPGDFRKSTLLL